MIQAHPRKSRSIATNVPITQTADNGHSAAINAPSSAETMPPKTAQPQAGNRSMTATPFVVSLYLGEARLQPGLCITLRLGHLLLQGVDPGFHLPLRRFRFRFGPLLRGLQYGLDRVDLRLNPGLGLFVRPSGPSSASCLMVTFPSASLAIRALA